MRNRFYVFILVLIIVGCHHSSLHDKILLNIANKLMEQNPDSSLKLLKSIKYPRYLSSEEYAQYALLMSQALDKTDTYIESDSLINIALDYYHKTDNYEKIGYSYFYLSRCERNRGNAQGQAEALIKAIPFAQQSLNHKLLGIIYGEKATIYQNQALLDSMINCYKLSFNALSLAKDRRNITISLFEIGYGYYQENQLDSSLVYYKQAEKEANLLKDNLLLSSIYRLMSISCYTKGNYPLALFYLRKSTITPDVYDYHKYILFARTYLKMGNLDSTRYYLHKSAILAKSTDYFELSQILEEKQGNIGASLKFAKQLLVSKDSDFHKTLSTSFAGMEKKYNYEKLATENKTLIIANQRNKIAVLFLLLGLSAIIVIVLLWRFRHKQQQLEQHQQLMEKEKENNLLLQQQINMQNALIKNVEHHKKTAIKRLVPSNRSSEEESASDSFALYDELITSIDGLYNGFSQRLKDRFPQLTTTDILICCLLRAGFESGMIASVLDTQTDSFNVRRTRLRKKLEIQHGENFSDFLSKF